MLSKIAQLAYVTGMIALLGSGTIAGILHVDDAKLWGVEQDAERPRLAARTVYDETFQRGFVTWFEQHWGLRGYAVKTDNTIVEGIFGESRRSENVVLGKNGVLLPTDDVRYANRDSEPGPTIEAGRRIARVQSKLRAVGRTMIPVIVPAKTSLARESVPDRWRQPQTFGQSDRTVYGALVRTLEATGAKFVDGRAILTSLVTSDGTFARTGRHWRMGPACAVLRAAMDVVRTEVADLGTDNIDCTVEPVANPSVEDEDYDLYRLRNVWTPQPPDVRVLNLASNVPPPAAGIVSLSTLFQGSSFTWKFVRIAGERDIFNPSLFYYYDSSVVDTKTLLITGKVTPYTAQWRKDTFGKRVIIAAVLESMLPGDGERFFTELENAVDRGEVDPAL